jgi:thioesterase domain-containing protein
MTVPDVQDVYPLSPMQRLFWIASAAQPRLGVVQFRYRIEGAVDIDRLERAWVSVASRHEPLRTAIVSDGLDDPLHVVFQRAQVPTVRRDLSHARGDEQRTLVEQFLGKDRESGVELARAPLMRCAFLRLDGSTWEFVWTFYRGLLDGWSVDLLWNEVWRTYDGFEPSGGDSSPAVPQFRDYLEWLQGRPVGEAEAFWRETLRGLQTSGGPLFGGVGQLQAGDRLAEQRVTLPPDFTSALQDAARDHHLTLNSIIVGAWALTIAQITGRTDAVVGSTVAGRPLDLSGAESIVGMFINNIPVRLTIDRDEPLVGCLGRLQAQQVDSRRYEHVGLDEIQAWAELPAARRLFDTLVVFQGLASAHETEHAVPPGVRVTDLNVPLPTSYPLTLICVPGRRLALWIDYDPAQCDEATVVHLLANLRQVLGAVVEAPESRVGELFDRLPRSVRRRDVVGTVEAPARRDERTQVPARTPVEAKLLGIWRRLLGVNAAGMRDDFFAMGGSSLLAVRLFDEIAREFGKRLPLGSLFKGATPEYLANLISEPAVTDSSPTCLVPIQTEGSKPPFFLVHGIGGEVLTYRPLAAALAADQPVYGIQSDEHDSILPGDVTIEGLAAKYVAAIKTVAPTGPYLLGGYCGGATLAFEMAQQLRRAGGRVGLVAVIDHWLSDTAIEKRSGAGAAFDFLRNLPRWMMDDVLHAGVAEFTGRVRSGARRLWVGATFRPRPERKAPGTPDIRDVLGMWRFPDSHVPILEKYYRAFSTYIPRAYAGRVAVFKPRAMPFAGCRLRPDLGWRDLVVGHLDVREVPGSHATLLREPLVRHLAASLQRAIDEATAAACMCDDVAETGRQTRDAKVARALRVLPVGRSPS